MPFILSAAILKVLEPHVKGGYKQHEAEYQNDFCRNITDDFLKTPLEERPVSLSSTLPKDEVGMWVLTAKPLEDLSEEELSLVHGRVTETPESTAETSQNITSQAAATANINEENKGSLIMLIVGKEHDFNETTVKKKNDGTDFIADKNTGEADVPQEITPASPDLNTPIEQTATAESSTYTARVKSSFLDPIKRRLTSKPKEKKKSDKAKANKVLKMGHASLSLTGFMAGEYFFSPRDNGYIISNKSGRIDQGEEAKRKEYGIHKIQLLLFVAQKMQIETDLNVVGIDLYHAKTPWMKVRYDAEKFVKKHRSFVPEVIAKHIKKEKFAYAI